MRASSSCSATARASCAYLAARAVRRRRLHLGRPGAPLRARVGRRRDRPDAPAAALGALPVAGPRRHDQRAPGRRGRRGRRTSTISRACTRTSASRSTGDDPTLKAIEWLTPVGRGSRVTIVGAARSGKTEALRRLAVALKGVEGSRSARPARGRAPGGDRRLGGGRHRAGGDGHARRFRRRAGPGDRARGRDRQAHRRPRRRRGGADRPPRRRPPAAARKALAARAQSATAAR